MFAMNFHIIDFINTHPNIAVGAGIAILIVLMMAISVARLMAGDFDE